MRARRTPAAPPPRARRWIAASLAGLAAVLLVVTTTAPAPDVGVHITPAPTTSAEETAAAAEVEETPAPKPPPSRYVGIELSEEDVETLARLVWLEARGEPFEGQVAVVEVVLNRILSPAFPDTVAEVVYQREPVIQFSPAARIPDTTPGEEQYRAVEVALAAEEPITDADVVYFSTTAQNEREFATIGNHVFCRE